MSEHEVVIEHPEHTVEVALLDPEIAVTSLAGEVVVMTLDREVLVENPEVEIIIQNTGLPGKEGPPGPAGGTFHHVQDAVSDEWTIQHDLGFYPGVTVTVRVGDVLEKVSTIVEYPDVGTVVVRTSMPTSGEAFLS